MADAKRDREALKRQWREETLTEKFGSRGAGEPTPDLKAKNEQLKRVASELSKKAVTNDGKYILMYRLNMKENAHRMNAPALNKVECEPLETLEAAQKWITTEGDINMAFYICTKQETSSDQKTWKPVPIPGEKWVYRGSTDTGGYWKSTTWEPKQTVDTKRSSKAYFEVLKAMNSD